MINLKNNYNNHRFFFMNHKVYKIVLDSFLILIAYGLAFLIRFEFSIPQGQKALMFQTVPLAILICIIGLNIFKIYQISWKFASLKDTLFIFMAVSWNCLIFVLMLYFLHIHNVPRSVLIVFWLLELILLGGIRFSYRISQEIGAFSGSNKQKVLIIGAGVAGEMIIRQMKAEKKLKLYPAAIIDDDLNKQNTQIHGVPVLGGLVQIDEIIKRKKIDEIIIAVPSVPSVDMRRIVHACERTGIEFKTVPGPRELVDGSVTLNQVRKVRIEDLLDRHPVKIDINKIQELIQNKVVLITGAGGSIGSELSRQILRLKPKKLVCLDRAENSLFYLEKELYTMSDKDNFQVCVGDITNIDRCNKIFQKIQPDLVFHSAAYKHVPLMELHPEEAIHNNVIGTMNMIILADRFNVERFVLISTDKAVNPVSVMGASKRIAEKLARSYSIQSQMKITTVRFGNVLASFGSVVPLFQRQIEKGGPVTVTHPDMKRFFMTISESVKLILEASKMGNGNEIFVLDMGEPLNLVDLARHLIKLSGFEPDKDIPIEFTGIRPGEKLFEELWNVTEFPEPTAHPKIMKAKGNSAMPWGELRLEIEELRRYSRTVNRPKIIQKLQELIPDYRPFVDEREVVKKIDVGIPVDEVVGGEGMDDRPWTMDDGRLDDRPLTMDDGQEQKKKQD